MIRILGDGVVEVEDGFGTIQVTGDRHHSELLIEFAPWVKQGWCDGSAGRLAVRVPKSWHRRPGFDRWMTLEERYRVREWLAAPTGPKDLLDGIGPLLQLLTAGRYRVRMHELPSLLLEPRDEIAPGLGCVGGYTRPKQPTVHGYPIPVAKVVHLSNDQQWWYCSDTRIELVPTDHWPAPDRDTVRRYRKAVREGVRPAVVLLRPAGGGPAYVIDGHHKLAAYLAELVPPTTVDITRITDPDE